MSWQAFIKLNVWVNNINVVIPLIRFGTKYGWYSKNSASTYHLCIQNILQWNNRSTAKLRCFHNIAIIGIYYMYIRMYVPCEISTKNQEDEGDKYDKNHQPPTHFDQTTLSIYKMKKKFFFVDWLTYSDLAC